MTKSIFEPIKIQWGDDEYEIPANRIMGLIETIEDHVSYADLNPDNPKMGKIAAAYTKAIRYAGGKVDEGEVYNAMFDGATAFQVAQAIDGLLAIMIPPAHLQKKTADTKAAKSSKVRTLKEKAGSG